MQVVIHDMDLLGFGREGEYELSGTITTEKTIDLGHV